MSAMERVTGLDWYAWLYYGADACIKGAAQGAKSAFTAGTAIAASTAQWTPASVDPRILIYTAALGFCWALIEFLGKGLPTGREYTETATSVRSSTTTPAT